jgi:hypothetical protein
MHVSESETLAWNRARRGRLIELVMFVVFYTILTR